MRVARFEKVFPRKSGDWYSTSLTSIIAPPIQLNELA